MNTPTDLDVSSHDVRLSSESSVGFLPKATRWNSLPNFRRYSLSVAATPGSNAASRSGVPRIGCTAAPHPPSRR
eukprot:2063168-Prymnesium_polylepis.1